MTVKGNVNPVFSFKIGSASAVDFGPELRSVSFGDGEGEQTTFNDFATGVRPVAVTLSADLAFGTGKFYNWLMANAGTADVTWTYKLKNGTTSDSNPVWSGTCTLPSKPLFEVAAGNEKASFEVEVQLDSFDFATA